MNGDSAPEGTRSSSRPREGSAPASTVVDGTVVKIAYEDDQSGFRVLRVRTSEAVVSVVGTMPKVHLGEEVRAIGRMEIDARHGEQLRAELLSPIAPTTLEGIERYLSGGVVRGLGAKTARRIVETFGTETLHVLDHAPERLAEVRGLGRKRADALSRIWSAQRAMRELFVMLTSLQVPPSVARRIYKRYGDRALAVVTETPYRLAVEVHGVGFRTADALAQRLGAAPDHPERVQAGVLNVVQKLAEDGHTVSPDEVVVERALALLDPRPPASEASEPLADPRDPAWSTRATAAIETLLAARILIREPEGLAHRPLAAHEASLSEALWRVIAHAPEPITGVAEAIAEFEARAGVELAPAQRDAVAAVGQGALTVVTGGPGVGKTTVVRAILSLLQRAGLRTELAAPTGRAAKRMSEATGSPARTIHRLLEYAVTRKDGSSSDGGDVRGRFQRNATAPLDADALILDETSMLDVMLARSLVDAVPSGCRLVLVGDVDQLPSIGPGCVLRDVIDSGVARVVRLTQIFRQAQGSTIVQAAHDILQGREPRSTEGASDRSSNRDDPPRAPAGQFFVLERSTKEAAARTIVDLVANHVPRAFGLDPKREVQVLVPMVRGDVGTVLLNQELQQRLNPKPEAEAGLEIRRGSVTFRVGDRVMQIRNDYTRELWNGDVGHVVRIEAALAEPDEEHEAEEEAPTGTTLVVRLEDGREVRCHGEELDDLVLAYACTVHKAQGSEYPAVIVGLVNQHWVMLSRRLLYTAVTRARGLVVLVCSRYALREAARDARGEERRTTLARRLRERDQTHHGDKRSSR